MKKYIVFLISFFLLISYSLSFAERGAIKNIDSSGTDYYATTIEWPAGVTITDDGNRKISIDISSSLSGTDGRIVVFSDSNSGENSLMNQSDSNTVALDSGAHFETDEIRAVDPNNGVKVYSGGAGIFVDNGGNVGIGTTGPNAELEISSTSPELSISNTTDTDNGTRATDVVFYGTNGSLFEQGRISCYHDSNNDDKDGAIKFLTNDGSDADGALTERMVIDNNGNVGIGTTGPIGNVQISSTNAHGGYVTKIYEASSGTLTGATDTIELAIPSGWRILQCQLHVKTAVTDDAGDDTWSSELNDGGIEETISAGSAAAQNTNVNHWADADTWGTLTDAETDILLTPNGGNFSAGEIEAHCLCQGFDNWDNE